MEINQQKREQERVRLQRVYDLILSEIASRDENVELTKGELVSMRKSFWDSIVNSNEELANVIEIAQKINQLDQEQYQYERKLNTINKLRRLEFSPYFGRVDFQEKGVDLNESIYIGISSFIDFKSGEIYIYDWRSPISSIFYEYETGPAEYTSPSGKITGAISLKRQFKIFRNKIDYMFDSNIKIDDEILQEILGKNVDDKMKNIVTTIQKEQNRIIRDDKNRLVIVQGAAGSGKTSIALHRIAYILYKYRDVAVSSDNIVIFSPNQMFNDYISNVLPELGEENINQTTFYEYSQKFIPSEYKLEDFNEQLEYLITSYDHTDYNYRSASIKYKATRDFMVVLKNYFKYIESDLIKFEDIFYDDQLVMAEDELRELFFKDYVVTPISKRFLKIRERIYTKLNPLKKIKVKELQEKLKGDPECIDAPRLVARLTILKNSKELMDKINAMTSINVYKVYMKLFEDRELFNTVAVGTIVPENLDEIRMNTLAVLSNNQLHYEDIPAYLFLKGKIEGLPNLSRIKHVVIDEAQDYSPLQYEIFKQLFETSSFTILGDLNQSIHPYMHTEDYQAVLDIFSKPDSSIFKLYKSYRSVKEIVEFSKAILPSGENIDYINRPGEKPSIIKIPNGNKYEAYIIDDIEKLLSENFKSIAVICKTEAESQKVYKQLIHELHKRKSDLSIKFINKDSEVFTTGLILIPSFLSKGLEFDAVILYDASSQTYHHEEERKLFYTICTRSLHRLHMYYQDTLTPFIPDTADGLYNTVIL
jgi:DNA helicase-2/ATP-dependent DNA helicase PcrA